MIENFIVRRYMEDYGTRERRDYTIMKKPKEYITFCMKSVVNIALLILAIYFSVNCSEGKPLLLRILYVLIATCFSSVYVIYYFVYHILLHNPC